MTNSIMFSGSLLHNLADILRREKFRGRDGSFYERVELLARQELALAESIGDESGMGNALAHPGMVAETREE